MGLGFGAVTAKSITRLPRLGHPQPNLVAGGRRPGRDWSTQRLPESRAHGVRRVDRRVAASRAADRERGRANRSRTTWRGQALPLGDLVEVNISSPNTKLVYAWNERPQALREVLQALGRVSPRPLIVKLHPISPRPTSATSFRPRWRPACASSTTATRVGSRSCVLSQRAGGLSGPEIFPTTLDNVRRTRSASATRFRSSAPAGVDSPDKAAALLDAGARAVSYFTRIHHPGPDARAAHPGTTGASRVSSAQLIHISTSNPQSWKSAGLARARSTVESFAASFVHNIGLRRAFTHDDWPEVSTEWPKRAFGARKRGLDTEFTSLVLCVVIQERLTTAPPVHSGRRSPRGRRAMEGRKPLAKDRRTSAHASSGVTVAYRGTRTSTTGWPYIANGSRSGKLILADHASERKVKGLPPACRRCPARRSRSSRRADAQRSERQRSHRGHAAVDPRARSPDRHRRVGSRPLPSGSSR